MFQFFGILLKNEKKRTLPCSLFLSNIFFVFLIFIFFYEFFNFLYFLVFLVFYIFYLIITVYAIRIKHMTLPFELVPRVLVSCVRVPRFLIVPCVLVPCVLALRGRVLYSLTQTGGFPFGHPGL